MCFKQNHKRQHGKSLHKMAPAGRRSLIWISQGPIGRLALLRALMISYFHVKLQKKKSSADVLCEAWRYDVSLWFWWVLVLFIFSFMGSHHVPLESLVDNDVQISSSVTSKPWRRSLSLSWRWSAAAVNSLSYWGLFWVNSVTMATCHCTDEHFECTNKWRHLWPASFIGSENRDFHYWFFLAVVDESLLTTQTERLATTYSC